MGVRDSPHKYKKEEFRMGKLHEVLAVEPDLRASAQQETSRVTRLFSEGRGQFVGETRKYHPLHESGEQLEDKDKQLGTVVRDELLSLKLAMSTFIDVSVQKEITNIHTCANIVVDDKVILEDLPAPALLNLENKLATLRKVYQAIPVLDPSEEWIYDDGSGCYVSKERRQYRTKKVPRTLTKAEATEHHPAQVEVWMEDVQVGTWTTRIFSGMVTIQQKKTWLDRVDVLLRAVKTARQRANNIDATNTKVAEILFLFIHSGVD